MVFYISNYIKYMSVYAGGVLESSSCNVFVSSSSKDFVLRTNDLSQKLIIGNTPCNLDVASLYVQNNRVGLRKVPGANTYFDAPGFFIDTGSNVNITSTLNVGAMSLTGSITPSQNTAYDLGSATQKFRSLYLAGSLLSLGGAYIATSNNTTQFLDSVTSNAAPVTCSQLNLGTAYITSAPDGSIQYQGTTASNNGQGPIKLGVLSNIGYVPATNYWGFGNASPQSTLYFNNSNSSTQMRLIFTDATTNTSGGASAGYQFWKDSTGDGYVQNYFSGGNIHIKTTGTQNIGFGSPNINIGDLGSTGQVVVRSLADAYITMQNARQQSNAGIVLDAATAGYTSGTPGARKFYIRATGNLAQTPTGSAGDRAGVLEIGDFGGSATDPLDASARCNLVVIDKYARMWIGQNVVPGKMGAAVVGTGSNTDAQPAMILVGHSNATGLKFPMVHLARNGAANDLSGFGVQLVDASGSNALRIGRTDAKANNGNPTSSNDLVIDATGNVAVGASATAGGSFSNRFTVQDASGIATTSHAIVATNAGSFLGLQPLSQASATNPLVASNDARISFSFSNSANAGALAIVPFATSRRGMRLTASGTHEIAGDLFLNGNVGVGTSAPAYNMDVVGTLRVTSNAYMPNVSVSNLALPHAGTLTATNISATSNVINIGCDSNTTTVNVACSTSSQIVNIGAGGTSNTIINIGSAGDTVNITGSTNIVATNNTTSSNKTIDLNYGGGVGTGGSVGINVNEGSNATGYIRTSIDRNAWLFKAPNAPELKIDCTGGSLTLGGMTMSTNSNVGVGTTTPQYNLDVNGTLRATTYCNLQWSFIAGVPTLSGFSNDLSNFSRPVVFNSNVTANSLTVTDLSVVGTATVSNMVVTTLTGSNAAFSNVSASITTTQIQGTYFGSAMTIGCDTNTSRVDIGVGATTLLNIGKNNDGTVINIGGFGDTVNIPGTLIATLATTQPQSDGTYTYLDLIIGVPQCNITTTSTQLVAPSFCVGNGISPLGSTSIVNNNFRVGEFSDPNLLYTLNKNSLTASGSNCGIQIEENGAITSFIHTTDDRAGWVMKAPASTQTLTTTMGANYVAFNSNTLIMVGNSNGTVGMGTNNPNTAYKLHVAGPLFANQYYNLPVADVYNTSGIVTLCNAVNSPSTTAAATAQAVQTVYNAVIATSNLASGRWVAVNATPTVQGISYLCDSTSSNNLNATTAFAATPAAVATTYAFAATKWASNDARSTSKGIAYLTDSTSCNVSGDMVPIAASAKAVYQANQLAASKWTPVFASRTSQGYVYVSDATNCNRSWSNVDATYLGPIAASVKAVFDTMSVATAASNYAYTTVPASYSNYGSVVLSDSLASASNSSNGSAATPYAVSQVYSFATAVSNLAASKWSNLNATNIVQGTVLLTDAVNSNTLTASAGRYAASPYAVSAANTLAITASNRAFASWTSNKASTSSIGIVYITDSTSCNASSTNSVPVVPTAFALSNVFNVATIGSNQAFTHPALSAATNVLGHVYLCDSTSSNTLDATRGYAATPKAVATLYNTLTTQTLSNIPTAQGSTVKGAVFLTDSTTCNVSQTVQPIAASAYAVNIAYQQAVAASNWATQLAGQTAIASLTRQGLVQLNDNPSSTSITQAATINSVSLAYSYASNALPRSGGVMTGDVTGAFSLFAQRNVTSAASGEFLQMSSNALIGKNTSDLRFGFAADLTGANWTEQARLTSSGKLGLGTSNPAGPLHIYTGAYNVSDPTTSGICVYNYAINNNLAHATMVLRTNSATGGNPFITYQVNGVAGWATGVDNEDSQKFKISRSWNSLNTSTALTITTTGNVGIATSSPSAPLHVNGSAIVTGGVYLASNSPIVGNCQISSGPGDGASYSTYNLKIASHYGIGFQDNYSGSTNIVFDCRTGNASFKGSVTADTVSVDGVVSSSNGIYAYGTAGCLFPTYGGGWYMMDSSWLRAYGNKNIHTAGHIATDACIGAGTTDPQYPIDAVGIIHTNGSLLVEAATYSQNLVTAVNPTSSNNPTAVAFGKALTNYNAGYVAFQHRGTDGSQSNYVSIGIQGQTTTAAPLTVNGYGNVGISSSAPAYKLDVAGQANATTLSEGGVALSSKYVLSNPGVLGASVFQAFSNWTVTQYAPSNQLNNYQQASAFNAYSNWVSGQYALSSTFNAYSNWASTRYALSTQLVNYCAATTFSTYSNYVNAQYAPSNQLGNYCLTSTFSAYSNFANGKFAPSNQLGNYCLTTAFSAYSNFANSQYAPSNQLGNYCLASAFNAYSNYVNGQYAQSNQLANFQLKSTFNTYSNWVNGQYASAASLTGYMATSTFATYSNFANAQYAPSNQLANYTLASTYSSFSNWVSPIAQAGGGTFQFSTNAWITSKDNKNRLYCGTNSRTYYGSADGHEWRNAVDTSIMVLTDAARLGVNTNAPECALDVNGISRTKNLIMNDAGYVSLYQNSNMNTTADANFPWYGIGCSTGTNKYVSVGGWGGLKFFTNKTTPDMYLYDGKLGVGTTSPGTAIDAAGVVRATTSESGGQMIVASSGGVQSSLDFQTTTAQAFVASRVACAANGTTAAHLVFATSSGSVLNERMRIKDNGYVGINTTTPAYLLDVLGTARIDGMTFGKCGFTGDYAGIAYDGNNTTTKYALLQGSDGTTFLNCAAGMSIRIRAANTDYGAFNSVGWLGIGTTSPSFPVHVNAYATVATNTFSWGTAQVAGGYWYQNKDNTGTEKGAVSRAFSMYASQRICTGVEFTIASDQRIKTNAKAIETSRAIDVIKNLIVKEFDYIDQVANDNCTQTGFIAQEVESVCPDAISKVSNFIPNVFVMCPVVDIDPQSRTLFVKIDHDIQVGKRVKCAMKAGDITTIATTVVSVMDGIYGLRFPDDYELEHTHEVFVYGEEVDDFQVLEKNTLFSLNIAATQHLIATQEAQAVKISALERQVLELGELVRSLIAVQQQI
jgi:Phage T4 tail fibre/Chaperone of endosialidase/Phage tail fibre repeat